MNCVDKRISVIIPYERNPRRNEAAIKAVAESIKQFGFRQPIVIDGKGVIIAGHTRYKAAQLLGLETVPCVDASDLTAAQVKAYRLADNKTAELAEWDELLLASELSGIPDIDMTAFGFDPIIPLTAEDDFDASAALDSVSDPLVRVGEVWALGRHRLMCGDSTDEAQVQKLMQGQTADMYLTDPPYGVDYEGKTADKLKIQNDNLSKAAFSEFLCKAFTAAERVLKAGGAFYVWHADTKTETFRAACKAAGLDVRQCLVWAKNSFVLGRQDYHWQHEPCLYGWKPGAAHKWCGDRKQSTVLEFDRPQRSDDHPTMKPVLLFDRLIQNSAPLSANIFDGFAGSGTTLIAAEQNGRTAFVMEIDPKHCDVTIARWEALTGLKAKPVM